MAFTADSSPVIVPLGGSAATTIHWNSGSPDDRVQIFERLNQGPWTRRALSDPAISGSYSVSFRPGDVYDALMFFADRKVDPNDLRDETPVLDSITVFALLPTPTTLITDGALPDQHEIGGTYYFRRIATGSTSTFAIMEVGNAAPVADAVGLLHIPKPLFTLGSPGVGKVSDPPKTIHDFQATPIDPGTNLFGIARVHDGSGNWQQISFSFTTRRRNIKLQWKDLKIKDDGVAIGSGSGYFRVEIFQAGNALGDLWWQRITTFNTGDNFNILPQNLITETGLHAVVDSNRFVTVKCWGKSYRSWPRADEVAQSPFGGSAVKVPTGRGKEAVVNRLDTYYAAPEDDSGITGAFSFIAFVLVSINYLP